MLVPLCFKVSLNTAGSIKPHMKIYVEN